LAAAAARAFLIALAIFASALPANAAQARQARCRLQSAYGERFEAPCDFRVVSGGGFSIAPIAPRRTILGASIVNVAVIAPGRAEVSGLTSSGINSRWGPAKRSAADRACWVGSDFRICVY
jgi:hypothetical protein